MPDLASLYAVSVLLPHSSDQVLCCNTTGSQAKEVACQTVRDLPDNLDCALAVLKVVCTKAKGYQVCHRHCNLPRVQHYSVSKLVFVVPHQNSQLIQHIKELLCVLKG